MRKPLRLFLILFFLLFTAHRSRAYGDNWYYGNYNYHFEISDSDIGRTPEWHVDEDLPLAAPKAVQSAKKELEKLVGSPNNWRLSLIEITPYGDGKHWFYLVSYLLPPPASKYKGLVPFSPTAVPQPAWMKIPVLMDGAVVQPEVSLIRK